MSKPIIEIKHLSKKYKIGTKQPYYSLRDNLIHMVKAPLKTLKREKILTDESTENTFWALKDISFEVMPGEAIGIIGRNGAGKSTLLKILSQITPPTKGEIILRGRVASLLEVGTGFHPELTGRENIYLNGTLLGMKRTEIKKRFDEIVDFAEIDKFLDTPVKHYSSGMYTRLAFAVAAHLEPEVLIVDEVLAVGDLQFQKKCLGKMGEISKSGRTVLFVSHDLSTVQTLCTHAILLHEGKIIKLGTVDEIISTYIGKFKGSTVEFNGKYLKNAQILQKGDCLELSVEYNSNLPFKIPCLGFVVSDALGHPLFGTNPVLDALSNRLLTTKKGKITIAINYPKLLNGNYRLSLWFGDGKTDFFHAKDCLTFEVVNMKKGRQLSPLTIGPIVPECRWDFK